MIKKTQNRNFIGKYFVGAKVDRFGEKNIRNIQNKLEIPHY